MSNSIIRVGTVGYPLPKKTVLGAVDIVEITESRTVPPKPATARRWRKETPGNISFTTQLSRYLFDQPPSGSPLSGDPSSYGGFQTSPENIALWDRSLTLAKALEADTVVLITPAEFTPAPKNRVALSGFFQAVDRQELSVVWEHHGPWDHDQATDFAAGLDLILAVDPLRDPPPAGTTAYLRLGPFAAMGSRMGVYDLEQLVDVATEFEKASVLFETTRAVDDVRNFKKILAGDFD
jgi:uncharacterized protein YecE (DUF72 family)